MSKSEDVNTLYRRFGGNAGTYQEIGANEMAGAATRRWPILGELRPQAHKEAPNAHKGAAASGERQVGSFLTPVGGAGTALPVPEQVESMVEGYEACVVSPQSASATEGSESRAAEVVAVPHQEPIPEPVEKPSVEVAVKSVARAKRRTSGGRTDMPRADVVDPPVAQTLKKPAAEKPKKAAAALPQAKEQSAPKKRASSAPIQDARVETGSELQSLFNRLVPPKPDVPVVSTSAPLKRLVKW